MKEPEDLRAVATSIVDSNRFMTLATADAEGRPWASPHFVLDAHDRRIPVAVASR